MKYRWNGDLSNGCHYRSRCPKKEKLTHKLSLQIESKCVRRGGAGWGIAVAFRGLSSIPREDHRRRAIFRITCHGNQMQWSKVNSSKSDLEQWGWGLSPLPCTIVMQVAVFLLSDSAPMRLISPPSGAVFELNDSTPFQWSMAMRQLSSGGPDMHQRFNMSKKRIF